MGGVFRSTCLREPLRPQESTGAPPVDAKMTFENEASDGSKCWQSNAEQDAHKIFIDGLAQTTPLQTVVEHFKKYGEIKEAVVMVDRYTGTRRGCAFVVFDASVQIGDVLNDVDSHFVDGKGLIVRKAPSSPMPEIGSRGSNKQSAGTAAPTLGMEAKAVNAKMKDKLGAAADDVDLAMENIAMEVERTLNQDIGGAVSIPTKEQNGQKGEDKKEKKEKKGGKKRTSEDDAEANGNKKPKRQMVAACAEESDSASESGD